MGRPKKVVDLLINETFVKFEILVNELKSHIESLEKKVEVLEIQFKQITTKPETVVTHQTSITTTVPEAHVPQEYREIINLTLNRFFGIRIMPRTDSPHFELFITVPEKYSNLSKMQRETLGGDLRVRVLNYAEGVNGVRDYAEKVYKTFSAETQSQIIADRV